MGFELLNLNQINIRHPELLSGSQMEIPEFFFKTNFYVPYWLTDQTVGEPLFGMNGPHKTGVR